MSNDNIHSLESYRDLARDRIAVCRSLCLLNPRGYREPLAHLVMQLSRFPPDVYDDDELLDIASRFVEEETILRSIIPHEWERLTLLLKNVHRRRLVILLQRLYEKRLDEGKIKHHPIAGIARSAFGDALAAGVAGVAGAALGFVASYIPIGTSVLAGINWRVKLLLRDMGGAGFGNSALTAGDTVALTAYYPRTAVCDKDYLFVVYAHLPKLTALIENDVSGLSNALGDGGSKPNRAKHNVPLALNTPISVVPQCDDVCFEPSELTKKWNGSYKRFLFSFEPKEELAEQTIVINLSIQVAGIEIAMIRNCAIEIVGAKSPKMSGNSLAQAKLSSQTSTLYQKIFVSYSRQDSEVAESYDLAQKALGNETFIDVENLRSGENWRAGLAKAIDIADVFQLFWSHNSKDSEYCREVIV